MDSATSIDAVGGIAGHGKLLEWQRIAGWTSHRTCPVRKVCSGSRL